MDSLLDIPILLPPLVVGLSLLILFNRVTPSMCCLVLGGTLAAAALVGLFNRSKLAAVLGVISLLLLVTSWLTRGGSDSLESVFFSSRDLSTDRNHSGAITGGGGLFHPQSA